MSLKYRMTPQGMQSMYSLAWGKAPAQPREDVFAEQEPAQSNAITVQDRFLAGLPNPVEVDALLSPTDEVEQELLLNIPLTWEAQAEGHLSRQSGIAERMSQLQDRTPLHLLRLGYVG